MDSKDINKFPIREYLAGMNIHPAKDRGYYGMYHSPFREDSNASMKVDFNKNLWIDYGTNEGGTLIDLEMRIHRCSVSEAMTSLSQHISTTAQQTGSFSFHGNSISKRENINQEPNIQVISVDELKNIALLQFLKKRCVDIEIAKQYCKEVHYNVNNKPYYAIGFQNDANGWSLRNEHFKGCILSMGATFVNTEKSKETCLLFEGFTDFLSYLTLKKNTVPEHDTIVLNSVSNLARAKNTLLEYSTIKAFLDNDEGGKQAVQNLRLFCNDVRDQSAHYAKHKDLNDYLCERSAPKQVVKKRLGGGLKM